MKQNSSTTDAKHDDGTAIVLWHLRRLSRSSSSSIGALLRTKREYKHHKNTQTHAFEFDAYDRFRQSTRSASVLITSNDYFFKKKSFESARPHKRTNQSFSLAVVSRCIGSALPPDRFDCESCCCDGNATSDDVASTSSSR